MLGLANTVSSSSTPESKYSLEFDGTDDYLDLGDHDEFTFGNGSADSAFSVSAWINTDTANNFRILSKNSASDAAAAEYLFATRADNGKLQFTLYDGGNGVHISVRTSSALNTGEWYYAVGTYDSDGTESGSYTAMGDNHTASLEIGRFVHTGDASGSWADGKITDVAIWNVALDAAAVTAIYNSGKPTNLTFDDGGSYDNSSALVAYWRMGNGLFDDKANGVIHDQHAPGFGSEMWDGVQGDDANWELFDGTVAEDDGAVKITYDSGASGAFIRLKDDKDLNADLVVGKTYKMSFSTKVNQGSIVWVCSTTGGGTNDAATAITSTSFETRNLTFIADHATNVYVYSNTMAAGDSVWIKDISLKQLNGLPALTSGGPTFSSDTP